MNRRRVLVETAPVLILCALGGALTGYILGNMTPVLKLLPGLIAFVPAIIGMRGNISSALGSRLGSAVHLGLVEEGFTSDFVLENLKGSLSLNLFVSILLPFFFLLTSLMFGFQLTSSVFFALFSISVLTGLTSGILLSTMAFFIVISAVKFGLDPDNITGPLLTTVGDVLTLIILFTYSSVIGGLMI
ncbi:MAG: magnesium transporter [Thermoplasmatota archaeon]